MLKPRLNVIVSPNRIAVTNVDSGQTSIVDAPFSCSHFLIDDVDIFEHGCARAAKAVARGFWLFPRVTVSTNGRAIHNIEAKLILAAWTNVGASKVDLAASVERLDEQREARLAYVEAAKRMR